jgi:hypothetical protein
MCIVTKRNYPGFRLRVITKESIIKKTYASGNLPSPLFANEGEFLPFAKGGKEGFSLQCPYNLGLTNNSEILGVIYTFFRVFGNEKHRKWPGGRIPGIWP